MVGSPAPDPTMDSVTDIDEHPRRDDLAKLVRTLASSAADEQRARFVDGLDEVVRELELEGAAVKIEGIDVLKALQRAEPPVASGRRLLGRLLVRGIALEPPAHGEEAERAATGLCWLAAHTYLDALSYLDELDDEAAAPLLHALGSTVRQADELGAAKGRAEALVAAAAIAACTLPAARRLRANLSGELSDALLVGVLQARPPEGAAPAGDEDELSVAGEMVPAPLGPLGLVMWCVTGLILLRYLWRFVANVILRCKRPAEMKVGQTGVTLSYELSMLGRSLRTRETHIPKGQLAKAIREVRYPSLAWYAGLLALAVGTFVGVSFVTDGARAGSPSLLALGAAIFGVGVLVDLVFSSLLPAKQGRYRVLLVPRRGPTLALSCDDDGAARRALRVLAR
jgi:hypothetical protein